MKITAKVRHIAVRGINKIFIGCSPAGEEIYEDMPDAVRVEIEVAEDSTCMFHRYGKGEVFCGDSWFEALDQAKHQGATEYDIGEADWVAEIPAIGRMGEA